jgi:3,4-dihydroxy 2-butanone 4-phosphate synthase / GTP cyclohydrolase II
MKLATVVEALETLKAGKPVLVVDHRNRENEGDAIMAAQFASPEWIAWMVKHTSGFLCAPMAESLANHLELPLMTNNNQDRFRTQYTVSVDAAHGVTTGISAADRAETLRVLANPESMPAHLIRPGHVIPLRAHPDGVFGRPGHTEATVDLLKLAGLVPVGVIAEMVSENGEMMRLPELIEVGERENLPVISIEQIFDYREIAEAIPSDDSVQRIRFEAEAIMPSTHGTFKLRGYYDTRTTAEHVAIIAGNPTGDNVLVRMHSECITGEAFGSKKCECGPQLDYALDAITNDPKGGVVIYLRGQEGRGIGLLNKLKAYALQDKGMDTVEANLALGLPSEAREYGAAVSILRDLGIKTVRLMSNNPAKIDALEMAGISVTEYVPIIVGQEDENAGYLETKREKMGHILPEAEPNEL